MAQIRLIPFGSSDIDRLLGWIRSPEELMLWNPAAIACYERVGFRRDGVRRDSFLVSEEPARYWSEVVMSVLAGDRSLLP